MLIIRKEPNPGGAYAGPQLWRGESVPEDYAAVADGVSMDLFYAYNGFVSLTMESGLIVGFIPKTEMWEAWKASNPDPEPEPPTIEERVSELEDAAAALEDAICEMDAANEERMAAIEDALCEMDMG